MTKANRRAIIEYAVAKPFVDALALGLGSSAFAFVLQAPTVNWGFIGGGFSLFWYWGRGNLARPKRRKKPVSAVGVLVNGQKTKFEYPLYQPGHIVRETWGERLRRWTVGNPEPVRVKMPELPDTALEFIFHSRYEGQPVELREGDVRRFLRTAWKNRQRGRGLSHRRWVREWRSRPQWYKDLGPWWYRAALSLLREAQQLRRCQLVVCIGPQWYALARDPHITLGILREAEKMKTTTTPHSSTSEMGESDLDISFDRDESNYL